MDPLALGIGSLALFISVCCAVTLLSQAAKKEQERAEAKRKHRDWLNDGPEDRGKPL